ncbi:hypothetical protein HAX54_041693, partial [Datura stramonium]|nr:hypothetical protein [Datura stramonium]
MVISSSNKSSKILVGVSLDVEESKELISWAIRVLANPNDTIIALHIVVGEEKSKRFGDQRKEESKKWQYISKNQTQIRKAKSFVISMMGEFTKTCQSKQVGLEARVGFSSNAGRGLIKEAKSIPADFLLIGGKKNKTCRYPFTIAKYCCERVPDNCSLVVVARKSSGQPPHNIQSNSIRIQENHQPSSRWPKENNSPSSEKQIITRHSPRTVLDSFEGEEKYSSSFGENSMTKSSTSSSTTTTTTTTITKEFKYQQEFKKQIMSPLRRISSFLRSPFDSSSRKKSSRFQNEENKQPSPILKCFSYEEIAISTNYFHPENLVGQGGYSDVYRGDVKDGRTIAIKRLAKDSNDMKKEKEFLMELGVISHVNHPNTASLVGYCIENGFYLIFKFYPNGTLSSALH